MIHKAIIVALVLAAMAALVLGTVSRQRPLRYYWSNAGEPTGWKLRSANLEQGMIEITFQAVGKFVDLHGPRLQGFPTGRHLLVPRTPTIRERLRENGFYARYNSWLGGGGRTDRAGNSVRTNARCRRIDVGVPAWCLFVLFLTYPTLTVVCGQVRRYRRVNKNQCVSCGYDLTGNESGTCPECGTEVAQ